MLFSKLSGFDPSNLAKLPAADRLKLEAFSLWSVLGVLGCSVAASYLLFITTRFYGLSFLAFIVVAGCLFAIQSLFNANRGLPIGTTSLESDPPAAKQFHILVYLLLTLVFTQPILIFTSKLIDGEKINELNRLESQLRVQGLVDAHNSTQAGHKRELAKIREKINTLGGDLRHYISNEDMALLDGTNPQESSSTVTSQSMNLASAARKALVIGNNAYEKDPLRGPIQDAKGIKLKLEKMGFSVTMLLDASRLTMEQELVIYMNTLKPGDISFVYFSGHGTQHKGFNYLVPVDTAQSLDDFISVNQIMQMQRDKSILASIIMTDACRQGSGYETGFDATGASRNTYIALAAAAGEASVDGYPNGVFTRRVLKHITKYQDIDSIFNIIKDEMARDPSVRQHPTAINLLDEPITLAVQKNTADPIVSGPIGGRSPDSAGQRMQCSHTKISSGEGFNRKGLLNQCISEFLRIKDDIFLERKLAIQAQNELEDRLRLRFSDGRFNPIYFLSYLWSGQVLSSAGSDMLGIKPVYRSLMLTLLIWFLLVGGLLMREVNADVQNTYRRLRVDEENRRLHSIHLRYVLMVNDTMDKFKNKLKGAISSSKLLKPDLAPHLQNPFREDLDIVDRENFSYLAGQDAINNLKKFLGLK